MLVTWLDQGSNTEGGTYGHGTHCQDVSFSAALIAGNFGLAPLPAAP